ncbi:hypothetical protein M3Y97_00047500 [Aphelenchoides bicaudatus]|nr:hypothetical protein M3Y97_00047500 [Aphelenchoides bicaudatus]
MSSANATAPGQNVTVYVNRYPWCKYLSYMRTAVGILTVFALFSAAIDSLIGITTIPIAIYLGVVAIPTFLLEFGRIIRMCCGTNGALCSAFSLVLDFDRWKRGLFYALLAVPCFFPSIRNTGSIIAGCCLFISGVLYVGKCFQKKKVQAFVPDPINVTTN